jgi:NADPH:quinone reductase-like Zn-dependent oxidoreductase
MIKSFYENSNEDDKEVANKPDYNEDKDQLEEEQGKVAVITGGSSGVGLAAAQRFVD